MERQYKDSGIEWIGRIPEEWKPFRFKALFTTGKGLNFTKAELVPEGISVVSYGQVHSKQNSGTSLAEQLIRFIPESLTEGGEASKVHAGDFIFADTSEDKDGCGNAVYVDKELELYAGYHTVVAFAKDRKYSPYLAYLFLTDIWRSQIRSRVTGIKVYSISQAILNQSSVLLPPLPEQQRIASYLDKKCGEIDALIALQEKMIAQLTEYKQAVITEAVTKGLDPNAKLVPSGIEWIGDVPEGWSINKINRLFRMIGSGTTPSSSDDDAYIGTINWLQSGDINGGIIANANKRISIDTLVKYPALSVYKQPFIIVAMYGASVGNISISHIDACVNQACCVMSESIINFNYAFYAIKSAQRYLIYRAVGGGQPNISQYTLRQLWLPVPPLPEQQRIATYLDTKCSEIDTLITLKRQKIESLNAYKKSVIYETVTGKTMI